MTTTLTTATVVRFVLIIDPNNEKEKQETIEYTDAADLNNKRTALQKEEIAYYKAHPMERYDPLDTKFFTEYRMDNDGSLFQEDGYSVPMRGRPSRKAGDQSYLLTCKCGKTAWWEMPNEEENRQISTNYVCEKCNRDDNDHSYFGDYDFTNYDGMQEREY